MRPNRARVLASALLRPGFLVERSPGRDVLAEELDVLDLGRGRAFVSFDVHPAEDSVVTVDSTSQYWALIEHANRHATVPVGLEGHDEGPRSVAWLDVEAVCALPLHHVQLLALAFLSVQKPVGNDGLGSG